MTTAALNLQAPRHDTANAVQRAAIRFQVDAGLIDAILADEAARWDMADTLQNALMKVLVALPPRPAGRLQRFAAWLTRRPLTTHSLGLAQMKLGTLQEVARSGFLPLPAGQQEQIRFLLDPLAAPYLVAARLRQTLDHWQASGVDLSCRPEILGTLYSLGLTGKAGVHAEPQPSSRGLEIAALAGAYRAAPLQLALRSLPFQGGATP
ncbi:hypothetical protein FNU79_10280 [Deinococcus detaillensis]|uniref:Uncharacterized protein n=1 Tax=Deinococcus detaillensis TaxID=2592048 RepID=A0A553UWN3_9DEIO|nr:hypothetical protein [Deinococcus detaillensis]TSA84615.1 hypothetical protein FNU79_10280 [Deinococcus detaillensis]